MIGCAAVDQRRHGFADRRVAGAPLHCASNSHLAVWSEAPGQYVRLRARTRGERPGTGADQTLVGKARWRFGAKRQGSTLGCEPEYAASGLEQELIKLW